MATLFQIKFNASGQCQSIPIPWAGVCAGKMRAAADGRARIAQPLFAGAGHAALIGPAEEVDCAETPPARHCRHFLAGPERAQKELTCSSCWPPRHAKQVSLSASLSPAPLF